MKIGYLSDSYPYKRNIVNRVKDVKYVKVVDQYRFKLIFFKFLEKFKFLKNSDKITIYENSFNDNNLNKVDLLHFFNNVSYGKTPWISTFETFIPRYPTLLNHQEEGIVLNKDVDRAIKALADPACKKIIALSECTLNYQNQLLNKYPMYREDIVKKQIVIHPPQKIYINKFSEKVLNRKEELSFIFVGKDFFRKGGLEMLNAFDIVKNTYNLPVKLTIVSSLETNDYATKSGKYEYELARKIINENKSWITHYLNLDNSKVLDLMSKHHVGVLPTWADTYGYSLLEMQACGCPVISTDVRALPEINNSVIGWMIKVPKNNLKEALYSTEKQKKVMREVISENLVQILIEIFNNKSVIESKSNLSISNIKKYHSIDEYSNKLGNIYSNIQNEIITH